MSANTVIDVTGIEQGAYMLSINHGSGVFITKILIQ